MPNQSFNPSEEEMSLDPEAGLRKLMSAGPSVERIAQEVAQKPAKEPVQAETPVVPEEDEEKNEEKSAVSLKDMLRSKLSLPSAEEIAKLKAQHRVRSLTVIPMIVDNEWNEVQYFIVKPLNRARWRAAMDVVAQRVKQGAVSENQDPEEVFASRLVTEAIVYPQIIEGQLDSLPAGLVPTIFGIVQKLSWFFEPEKLINLTITL